MRFRNRTRFSWLLGVAVLFATPHVSAQDGGDKSAIVDDEANLDDEIARQHHRAGSGYYRKGQFREAGEQFMKSYELSKRPISLFNAYIAYRDAGADRKAAEALRQYLKSEEKIEDRQNLEARLGNLEARLNALEERDRALAEKEKEAEAARQAAARQNADQQPATSSDSVDGGPGIAPIILMGVGGAAIVGGVITGIVTNGTVSDVESACPGEVCPAGFDLDGERDSAKTTALVTDILIFSGAALAVGGALWYLLDQPGERATTASAYCTGDGCGAVVQGKF